MKAIQFVDMSKVYMIHKPPAEDGAPFECPDLQFNDLGYLDSKLIGTISKVVISKEAVQDAKKLLTQNELQFKRTLQLLCSKTVAFGSSSFQSSSTFQLVNDLAALTEHFKALDFFGAGNQKIT